jgi:hypothetical protein
MQLFDQLMIIGAGKTLYYGPGPQVVDYFKSIGYTCPKFENPGDYISKTTIPYIIIQVLIQSSSGERCCR